MLTSPLAAAQMAPKACYVCKKTGKSMRCSQCKSIDYCGEFSFDDYCGEFFFDLLLFLLFYLVICRGTAWCDSVTLCQMRLDSREPHVPHDGVFLFFLIY